MDEQLRTIIHQVHDSPIRATFAVSGGGSQALAWLLSVPGASRTVLEVVLPYSPAAFERFVGFRPEQFVSAETAVALAKTAYRRSRLLVEDGASSLGVACTAALATDRPKRGAHRCYVAVCDDQGIMTDTLTLAKGARDRADEEDVVSRLLVRALAAAAQLEQEVVLGLLADEQVETTHVHSPDRLLQVFRGELPAIVVQPNQEVSATLPQGVALLSGSFAPLHGGHLQLAHVAHEMTNRPVVYELSAHNVDKPPLAEIEVRRRLAQFVGVGRVAITTAPLFDQKAVLFSDSVFVVGYDTAARIADPHYYGDDQEVMWASLAAVRDAGGRFLVAGRMEHGRFLTLRDIHLPEGFADLFAEIPPELFRVDISSTDLRKWRASDTGEA